MALLRLWERDSWAGGGRRMDPRMSPSQDWKVTISPTGEDFSVEWFERHKRSQIRVFYKSPCGGGNTHFW